MFGGLNRLLVSAVLAGAVLVLPPAALSSDCGGAPSAENVYKECLPSGGGGKPTGHGGGTNTNSGSGSSTSAPISRQTAKALKNAGKDGQSLANLVKGYGAARFLQSRGSTPATEPTAVASAFDLGSGPTALLIGLAGTAILLLAAAGFRGVQKRRH